MSNCPTVKIVDGVERHWCKKCEQWLLCEAFYRSNQQIRGTRHYCRRCSLSLNRDERIAAAAKRKKRRRYRIPGHKSDYQMLGPWSQERPGTIKWISGCICGWRASDPSAGKRAAKKLYMEHVESALPVCGVCEKQKLLGEMSRGAPHMCKDCVREKTRRWKAEHPTDYRVSARNHWLQKNYGLAPGEYELMLARQGGKCAICGSPSRDSRGFEMHVDHDRSTKRVRGILCGSCNMGLGSFRDLPERLLAAVAYLKRAATEGEKAA